MSLSSQSKIRPPAVANMFYPGRQDELHSQVKYFLDSAPSHSELRPKALIVPHAGYIYSGPVAATAYKTLYALKDIVDKVVLLGPAHRVYLRGIAASTADYFKTPLGDVPVDTAIIKNLVKQFRFMNVMDEAHAQEHSLEVHIPFLQETLDDFTLIPLVVGETNPDQVDQVLEHLWGDEKTLIVISSDLSHFHDYDKAQRLDLQTAEAIERYDIEGLTHDGACGFYPVRGMLAAAAHHHLQVHRVDLRNSGDTAGSKDRVVGYGSWIFTE